MSSLFIGGMHGLGDGINLRAFVGAACETHDEVYLATPWPQLYTALRTQIGKPVKLVPKASSLRTQTKNARAWTGYWSGRPGLPLHQIGYDWSRPNIIACMEATAPWAAGRQLSWDMPKPARPRFIHSPYAIVRPVTLRTEWKADARNPDPVYIQHAINELARRGYIVITVADIAPGQEDFSGPEPVGQHIKQHEGQGGLDRLMELVAHADVCVGGIGWLVPMAIAFKRPLFVVGGGHGQHNAPDVITDPRMDLSAVGWALPDDYCRCQAAGHYCPKLISNFDPKFGAWLDQVERRERHRMKVD